MDGAVWPGCSWIPRGFLRTGRSASGVLILRDGSLLFRLVLGVGGRGDFLSERERRREKFQGVRPLEAIATTRDHMLFELGWVDAWGEGKVVFFEAGECVGITGSGWRR